MTYGGTNMIQGEDEEDCPVFSVGFHSIEMDKTQHTNNVDIDRDKKQVRDEEKDGMIRMEGSSFLYRQRHKYPRIFNMTLAVLLPLLFLISLSLFCGMILVKLEGKTELDNNDSSIRAKWLRVQKIQNSVDIVKNSYNKCIGKFIESASSSDLVTFMEDCTKEEISESQTLVDELIDDSWKDLVSNDLSFHWNICSENGKRTIYTEQGIFILSEWLESQLKFSYQYISDGMNETAAEQLATQNASGVEKCSVNSAGGALFWFTTMTTIGYGNTVPVTQGGRALVCTLGFFSILAFTAVIGSARNTSLVIIDDLFLRLNLRKLTKGWLAVTLWTTVLFLYILLLSSISALYVKNRYGSIAFYNLRDRFWWAFISITTVGYGDIYIEHDLFRHTDMLYLPLILLVGFVIVASFMTKISDMLVMILDKSGFSEGASLENSLLQQRIMNTTLQNSEQYIIDDVHYDDDDIIVKD